MTTAELLTQRLELVYRWYHGMISPRTGMFEYLYVPQSDMFVRERSPIRDIASVWDVELLGAFLKRDDLRGVVTKSLAHYGEYLVERDGSMILDSARLEELSSIAHSAFLILAMLRATPPRSDTEIRVLAEGIRRQQRTDGSYKVFFADQPDSGEELYGGEAMLALLESYRHLHDARYLDSAERGLSYYDKQYFRGGLVGDALLVFFANWQSQSGRLLFESTRRPAIAHEVADYIFRMHDRIIDQGFFDRVARYPARQVSVEVACALEGLNDAYVVARASDAGRADRYRECLCAGLEYLLVLQCTRGGSTHELGGFGLTLDDRSQRIDITGHAASAFMKSAENGIVCPAAAP